MIDTHVHLLDPDRYPYPADTLGYRPTRQETGRIDTLRENMDAHGISHAVLVQASVYGTDNTAILEAAAADPDRFRAVVMSDAETVPDLARAPGVAGVRLNVTDYGAHGSLDDLLELGSETLLRGLVLQIQARPEDAETLLAGLPRGPVILDHFGLPDVSRPAELGALRRLSARDDCYLKVSGAFRLIGLDDWRKPERHLTSICGAFGPDRVIWGSDWPFIALDGQRPTYRETIEAVDGLIDVERARKTALRLFGWPDD